jgi:hypothetical protein
MLIPVLLAFLLPIAMADPCADAPAFVSDLTLATSSPPTRSGASDTRHASGIDLTDDAFADEGLRAEVFSLALTAWKKGWDKGDTKKKVLTVIDYSLPSDQKRLWVVDLETGKLLFQEVVAHGNGTGGRLARSFSNTPESKKSNVGLMRTAETYQSRKFGYSMRLDGLEKGFNDNARRRAIVMHRADYATEAFAHRHGRLGRSWGCPSIDPAVADRLIDTIKGGTLIFGYAKQDDWLRNSDYLN